jgi:hypothetical protein
MTAPDEVVEIFRAARIDAEIVRSLLESNGIEAILIPSGASAAYPVSVGSLGEARVAVRSSDEDAARALLAAAPETPQAESP